MECAILAALWVAGFQPAAGRIDLLNRRCGKMPLIHWADYNMDRMQKRMLPSLIIAIWIATYVCSAGQDKDKFPAKSNEIRLDLKQGQKVQVQGTDLVLTVQAVKDLAAKGCLGGPVGCPGEVRVLIAKGSETKQFTLHHGLRAKDRGKSEVKLFNYVIRLTAIQNQQAIVTLTRILPD
jgi:hypothetical protein